MVGSRVPGQLSLGVRSDGGHHLGSPQLGHLHDQPTGAAGTGVDQTAVSGPDPGAVSDQVVGGEALHAHSGGHIEVDAVGNLVGHRGVHRDPFGVGAHRPGPGHPVTWGEAVDSGSYLQHGPRALLAQNQRQRHVVEARSVVGVDEVHPGRGHFDRDLTLPGRRIGPLHDFHHFGPAGRCNLDGCGRCARSCGHRCASCDRSGARLRPSAGHGSSCLGIMGPGHMQLGGAPEGDVREVVEILLLHQT